MDILTTREAAALLGLSPKTITQAIRRGKLQAERFGRDWQIQRDDLLSWSATRRPVGRPRKKTEGE